MTTPEERQRAQAETRELLRELCDSKLTPGVPARLRHRAEGLLRHVASPGEIREMLDMALRLLQTEQERDKYRAAALVVTRRLLARVAVALAVALTAGILVGEWVSP